MDRKRMENVDRLSSLPEELVSHILCLMPTKYAVRTSILSKRWRYSWTSVTILDIDDKHPIHGLTALSAFVDRVLNLCKAPQLNLFRLHFPDAWVRKSSVSKWINEAVRLNVCELDIHVVLLGLPSSLFTCKTLTKLKLVSTGDDFDALECPSSVNLPCLKTLDIDVPSKPFFNPFKLVSGCPILESLSLRLSWCYDDGKFEFNIPTLKQLKLTIWKCTSDINSAILNVPNLESLIIRGVLCVLFVMEDVSSLVKASISFRPFNVSYNHLWVELLKGISGVKSLSWLCSISNVPSISHLPMFPNLKDLDIPSCFGWLIIPRILENSSELEHLCIEKVPAISISRLREESCWIEPKSVPTCMLTNLRTMKFTILYKGRECDVQFLKYMLGNAVILKTLTITCEGLCLQVREEKQLYINLLKLPRASRYCEIHFLGKWFNSTTSS